MDKYVKFKKLHIKRAMRSPDKILFEKYQL